MGNACSHDGRDSRSQTEAHGEEPSTIKETPDDDGDAAGQIVKDVLAREAVRIKNIEEQTAQQTAEDSGDGDDIDNFFGLTPNASQPDGRSTAEKLKGANTTEAKQSAANVQQPPPASAPSGKQAGNSESHSQEKRSSSSQERDSDRNSKQVGNPQVFQIHSQEVQSPKKTSKEQPSTVKSQATAGSAKESVQTNTFQGVMERLSEMRQQVDGFSLSVSELFDNVTSLNMTAGTARSQLAQIEAGLNKLQCKGIDAIEIASITDQKEQEQARAVRRELVKLADALFDRIDAFFRDLTEAKPEKVGGHNVAEDPKGDKVAEDPNGDKVAEDPAADSNTSRAPPKVDIVLECGGKLAHFAGTYKLDTQTIQNDEWTWRKQNGSEIIFFTKTKHILIASTPEAAESGRGSIRSTLPVPDAALLESAKWATYSNKDKKWCHDPDIASRSVLLEGTVPEKTASKTRSKVAPSSDKVNKAKSKI